MKNRFLLLITLACICFTTAIAQDSTEKRILAAKDDSAKVVQLADYAHSLIDEDKDNAFRLYGELMRLSRKLHYDYWIGMVWFNYGYMYAKEANDIEAVRNFDSALVYLGKTDRVDQMAWCRLNIGSLYARLGNTDAQLKQLTATLRLLENTKYKNQLSRTYNSLGVLFYNQDNYDKGLYYFQKANQLASAIQDTMSRVESLFGIVNCLSSQSKFEEALRYANEVLALATASKNTYALIQTHTAFSEMYRKWGKGKLCAEHAKKVVEYAIAYDDVQYQLIGTLGMADGFNLAGNFKEGLVYYQRALQLGIEKDAVIQLDDIYKGMSEAYAHTGQPAKALDLYKKYIEYRDSTTNEKLKKNAAELDIKYQTAQKEKALSEQQLQLTKKGLELQKSRNYMYYTLGGLIIAVLFAALLFVRMRYRKLVHKKELEAMRQQKELQLLQALMQGEEQERSRIAKDLHDGVAGMLAATSMHLSSILSADSFKHTEGYRQGMQLLNEATVEIRKTSHNLMPEVLLAHGLDEALRRYCNNINNENLVVQYDSWGDIKRYKNSFELSVYRIVQELLNNIVKHSKASRAIVQMHVHDATLSLTIEDNGIGFQSQLRKDGMGIRSMELRIRAMNGKMEMESEPGNGVSAYLDFDTTGLIIADMISASAEG